MKTPTLAVLALASRSALGSAPTTFPSPPVWAHGETSALRIATRSAKRRSPGLRFPLRLPHGKRGRRRSFGRLFVVRPPRTEAVPIHRADAVLALELLHLLPGRGIVDQDLGEIVGQLDGTFGGDLRPLREDDDPLGRDERKP